MMTLLAVLTLTLGCWTTVSSHDNGFDHVHIDNKYCGEGSPLTDASGNNVYCGRGGQRCPPGYECNIHPSDQWAVCCPNDACQMKVDPGPCKGSFMKWYYDPADSTCKWFIYGGCLGNANRFDSKEECERACGHDDHCDKHCCPAQRDLFCPVDNLCKSNLDCPTGSVCCPTMCKGRNVCRKPVHCCCPGGAIEGDEKPVECRDDQDCLGLDEKCCLNDDNRHYCYTGIPCPCEDRQMCCRRLNVEVKPNPDCQWCQDDRVCGPTEKCCPDEKGCRQCDRAWLCDDK